MNELAEVEQNDAHLPKDISQVHVESEGVGHNVVHVTVAQEPRFCANSATETHMASPLSCVERSIENINRSRKVLDQCQENNVSLVDV